MTMNDKLKKATRKVSAAARAVSAGAMLTAATLLPAKSMAQSGTQDVPSTKSKTTMVDTNTIKKELGLMNQASIIAINLIEVMQTDNQNDQDFVKLGDILQQLQENNKKNLKHNLEVINKFHSAYFSYLEKEHSAPKVSRIAPSQDFEKDYVIGKHNLDQARAGQMTIDTVALKNELNLLKANADLMKIVDEYNTVDIAFLGQRLNLIRALLNNEELRESSRDKDAIMASIDKVIECYNAVYETITERISLQKEFLNFKLPFGKEDFIIKNHLLQQARGK